MEPEPGDELLVEADPSGTGARVGTILAIRVSNGHPAYLVHWVAGDYDALISPWPGVQIQRRKHLSGTSKQAGSDYG
jgi:hypothetical protein